MASENAPGTTAWIDTDEHGLILDCSDEALLLLGYTHKGARGHSLLLMFLTNRPGLYQFGRALAGFRVSSEAIFRPRERRALTVRYDIDISPRESDDGPVLRWTLTALPSSDPEYQ